MSTFLSNLLSPGSSEALVPYTKGVTYIIVLVCSVCFYLGIARIHMVVMSLLSIGLACSLNYLESVIAGIKEDGDATNANGGGKVKSHAKES